MRRTTSCRYHARPCAPAECPLDPAAAGPPLRPRHVPLAAAHRHYGTHRCHWPWCTDCVCYTHSILAHRKAQVNPTCAAGDHRGPGHGHVPPCTRRWLNAHTATQMHTVQALACCSLHMEAQTGAELQPVAHRPPCLTAHMAPPAIWVAQLRASSPSALRHSRARPPTVHTAPAGTTTAAYVRMKEPGVKRARRGCRVARRHSRVHEVPPGP